MVTIEPVGIERASDVLEVMRAAFEEYRDRLDPPSGATTEDLGQVRAAIAEGGAFLAHAEGAIVGTGRYRARPGFVYAERVGVVPGYRGRGIGVALMEAIEAAAQAAGCAEVRLAVRASLAGNLRFYEGLGYRAIESRPHPRGPDFEITLSKPVSMIDRPGG